MLLCTPPRKYLLKKSCTLTALALLSFYANGSLANEFLVNKDNPWTGGRTLTFISDETNLSNHILTVDAQDNFWTGYKPTEIKLISIDDSKSENLSIVGNKAYIQNVDNITPCFIEISGTKNTEISGNLIEITNSASGQIRGMFVTNGTKAENILVQKNQIKIQLKDSDSTSQAQAINISGSGKIDDNTMEISGGGKSTRLIGVSGTNKTDALDITNNRLTIHDANFRFATTVSVSNTPYGIIQNNSLVLSGENDFNPAKDDANSAIVGVYAGARKLIGDNSNADILNTNVNISGILRINKDPNWSTASIGAAKSLTGEVIGNEITLDHLDLEIDSGLNVWIFGGYSGLDAYGEPLLGAGVQWNTLKLNGLSEDWANLNTNVILLGGYSALYGSADNKIELSNSHLFFKKSNYPNITGGYAASDSQDNVVHLANSTVSGKIVGSISQKGGQLSSTVTISDSSIEGEVSLFEIGTWEGNRYETDEPSNETIGQNSTLEITGINSDLSKANLFVTKTAGIQTSNNVLKIDGWQGEVGSLGTVTDDGTAVGFDHLAISGLEWKNGSVLIRSLANPEQGEYTVFNQSAIDDTSLVFTSAPTLDVNEQITILQADNGITYVGFDSTVKQKNVKANAGTATEFDGTISYEDDRVTYSVEKVERAHQTTVLGDSRIAAAAFVNQSNDLLAHVFSTFMHDQKYGLATFASAEGNRSQYDLDSSLKINGWNFMAGIRYKDRLSVGDWTSAIFLENGEGNYRTWNEHLGHTFKTNGELTYNGAGIATRLMTDSGFYSEGSVHLGQLKIEMNNALLDTAGNNWDFDSRSMYYGAHLGLGWLMPISSTLDFDLSGKYFYARTTSDTFRVNDEKYCFSNIDSHRLQLEGKLNYTENNVTLYTGLGVEYEFDGQSSMKAASTPKFVSDINGFTAIADLGMRISPSVNSPWLFQANVRGWEGERDGVSGTATIEYQF